MHPETAFQRMAGLLQQMARQGTNPLLQLLPVNQAVVEQHKYPETPLTFNAQPIRVYYHCHPAESRPPEEHGHFHIFLPSNDGSGWSHLSALAMDHYGQPLCWYTVNRWVTDGTWESAQHLLDSIEKLEVASDMSLVEQWLLYMLVLYKPEINTLLGERDKYLDELGRKSSLTVLLEERAVYRLSTIKIDLLKKLESFLLQPVMTPVYG